MQATLVRQERDTLSAYVIAFVLLAAVLHASWNTLLRSGADRLWTMSWMCLAVAAVSASSLPLVTRPAPASWPYLIASAILHLGYNIFLVRAYRTGGLGEVYPIARGASPLLVAFGALLFAGERLSALAVFGILLVSAGIIALALRGRRFSYEGVPAALVTSVFIGAYSVTDGIGVRLAGDNLAYTAWMFLFWGMLTPLAFVAVRGVSALRGPSREIAKAAAGGVVSLVAYGLVIWAMGRDAMGPVSALRETSVVFAALFGRLFLDEALTLKRMVACVVIAIGASLLGFNAHAAIAGFPHITSDANGPSPGGAKATALTSTRTVSLGEGCTNMADAVGRWVPLSRVTDARRGDELPLPTARTRAQNRGIWPYIESLQPAKLLP